MSSQEPLVEPEHVLDSADAGGKLIRGGSIRVSGFVVSLLIGLLSAPLLVRHLSVSDFGLYATVMSLSFVVTGLTEGGIGNVAVREFSQSSDSERERLLTSLIGLRIVLTTIGFCLAILFTRIAGYPPVVTLGVAICAVGVLLGAVQNTLAVPLAASLRLGELTAIDLSRQVTSTIIIVGLVVAGAALVPFFVAYSIAFFALLLATLYVLRGQRIPLRASFDRALWTALLRQTGIFALATAFAVAYFQVALISVSALSTDYQAGLYGAAFRVVDLANGIPWLLAASAFPIVARSAATDPERLRNALQRMFETAVVAGGALSVVIIVGAPVAMAFVGGGQAGSIDSRAPNDGRWNPFHLLHRYMVLCASLSSSSPLAAARQRGRLSPSRDSHNHFCAARRGSRRCVHHFDSRGSASHGVCDCPYAQPARTPRATACGGKSCLGRASRTSGGPPVGARARSRHVRGRFDLRTNHSGYQGSPT